MTEPAELYARVCEHVRRTALLTAVDSVLGWDERTFLPPAGAEYRAEQMSFLAGLAHERRTDSRLGEWLGELAGTALAADRTSDTGSTLHELKRRYDKHVKLPRTLVEELTRTAVLGQQVWQQARRNDDFASFLPLLERMFELKRQEADALGWEESPYDPLLDDYEPGARASTVAKMLGSLRDELVPFVAAIGDSGRSPKQGVLTRALPLDRQRVLCRAAAAAIGFDFDRGRLDDTVHPFCSTLGPNDIRITSRFDECRFTEAFFGIIHEAGHGIYEQGLQVEHFGLPLGLPTSIGVHESQSRLWENLVARSRPFWQYFWPRMIEAFPAELDDISADDFYFAANDVRPSLIRVDADEATYNIHILIRFELELALLTDDLPFAELPGAWHEKYEHYLGVRSPNDADGVLQDIHWAGGAVGYFPTYALGNLYASQFFARADADLGGLDAHLAKGEFAPLRGWLREKIYVHGQRQTGAGLVEQVTGRPLSHDPLMAHLHRKLGALYGL